MLATIHTQRFLFKINHLICLQFKEKIHTFYWTEIDFVEKLVDEGVIVEQTVTVESEGVKSEKLRNENLKEGTCILYAVWKDVCA